jgi:hypothetical protein
MVNRPPRWDMVPAVAVAVAEVAVAVTVVRE